LDVKTVHEMNTHTSLSEKKTLIIGASLNPARTSYTAMEMLTEHGVPALGVGLKPGRHSEVDIQTDLDGIEAGNYHTVTMYMNAKRQEAYFDFILSLNPKRIIFNPGAENPALFKAASEKGIQCLNACTLVMLNFGQF
jgi:hypothetical protein